MSFRKKLGAFFSYKDILNDCYRTTDPGVHRLSDEELQGLQDCLLSIFGDVMEACRKHGLKPFLAGGSLLGAVRHGGFIPWDDDFDIAMSRADYEVFKTVFGEELGEGYLLKVPNHTEPAVNRFMQIYKKGTDYRTLGPHNPETPTHVYIDIFPIDYAPDGKLRRTLKGYWCNGLMAIAGMVEFYRSCSPELKASMKKSFAGRVNLGIRLFAGWLFSFRPTHRWFDTVDKAIRSNKETGFCTSATGRKHYLGEVVAREAYYPQRPDCFLGVDTFVPNDSGAYLQNLYGDYMQIPPEDKREQHFVCALKLK